MSPEVLGGGVDHRKGQSDLPIRVPSGDRRDDAVEGLAYITQDLPGIGGRIKQRPNDFFVEEHPLYPPAGRGEHLYLYIEKRRRTTTDVIRRLAKLFRVGRGDVGYAGLKDKHAITRQLFSITLPNPSDDARLISRIDYTGVRVLWVSRHLNKLKRGHLKGNRFVIRVRGVTPGAGAIAREVLDRLRLLGAPNFVGQQRFGYRANNHQLGRLLLMGCWQQMLDLMLGAPRETDYPNTRAAREAYENGDYATALRYWPRHMRYDRQALDALRQGKSAQEAVMSIDPQQRGFLVSGLQSAIFNHALDRRIRDGLFGRLIEGDIAWKADNRAAFLVDRNAVEVDNAPGGRVEKLEVSPTGPMWGIDMLKAQGPIGEWEQQLLSDQGLDESHLRGGPQAVATGKRRSMRILVADPEVSELEDDDGPYLRVGFGLPSGSFATVVLREIMKPPPELWEMLS